MKKLRLTDDERNLFIEKIKEKMILNGKTSLDDLDITDIKKEMTAIPKTVKKPRIIVNADAYIKMLELINQSPVECMWHGLVERDVENNVYTVYDILVFPQINSGTSTTTKDAEFAEWQTKLITDPDFPIQDLRLHGHSHVLMNVFSSAVDDQYQKDILTKVNDGDYYIFFIMNKKMEICIFLYDFIQQIMFDQNDIEFCIATDWATIDGEKYFTDIKEWAKEELEENATTAKTTLTAKNFKWEDIEDDYPLSYYGRRGNVFPNRKGGK